MNRLLVSVLFTLLLSDANAQKFSELFRQDETQRKYMLQQIAALQVYIGYVQKGYSIAKHGLNMISDIKHGELNLHKDYFTSLKTVNLKIKHYSKVADIIRLQANITKVYKEAAKHVKLSGSFSGDEISYIMKVFERLISDCTHGIDELITVTTSGQLEMKDDERLKRVDALYDDMQDRYTFIQGFFGETKLLALSRSREYRDIKSTRALNDIKN